MAQKDQQLIFERAPVCRSDCRPGPIAPGAAVARRNCRRQRAADWKSASIAKPAAATKSNAASKATIPIAIRRCALRRIRRLCAFNSAAISFARTASCRRVRGPEQGRHPDHIVAEAKKLADEGCHEITLLGPNRQQLPAHRRRAHDAAVRFALPIARYRRTGTAEVRHEFPQRHDRRFAAGRARFAQVLAVFARAGPKRLERRAQADETRLHGRGISRHAGAASAPRFPTPRSPAISSSASAARRTTISSRRSSWCASRASRTASSSNTASAPARKPPTCGPTTCPKTSNAAATTSCWPCKTESARKTTTNFIGRTVEVLVEGPSKHAQKFDRTDEPDGVVPRISRRSARRPTPNSQSPLTQLVGRTPCDRIVVFEGNRRQIGQILPVDDLRLHADDALRRRRHA